MYPQLSNTTKNRKIKENSPPNNNPLPDRNNQRLTALITRVELLLGRGEGTTVVHVDGVAGLGSARAVCGVGGFDV